MPTWYPCPNYCFPGVSRVYFRLGDFDLAGYARMNSLQGSRCLGCVRTKGLVRYILESGRRYAREAGSSALSQETQIPPELFTISYMRTKSAFRMYCIGIVRPQAAESRSAHSISFGGNSASIWSSEVRIRVRGSVLRSSQCSRWNGLVKHDVKP